MSTSIPGSAGTFSGLGESKCQPLSPAPLVLSPVSEKASFNLYPRFAGLSPVSEKAFGTFFLFGERFEILPLPVLTDHPPRFGEGHFLVLSSVSEKAFDLE